MVDLKIFVESRGCSNVPWAEDGAIGTIDMSEIREVADRLRQYIKPPSKIYLSRFAGLVLHGDVATLLFGLLAIGVAGLFLSFHLQTYLELVRIQLDLITATLALIAILLLIGYLSGKDILWFLATVLAFASIIEVIPALKGNTWLYLVAYSASLIAISLPLIAYLAHSPYRVRDIKFVLRTPYLSTVLSSLFALMYIYGQDPNNNNVKIEQFEESPYCGSHYRCRIITSLGNRPFEVWIGRDIDWFLTVKGHEYDFLAFAQVLSYYFYRKHKYVRGKDIYISGRTIDPLQWEMWLCTHQDIVEEKIAKGEYVPIPRIEYVVD
jgi:hypothetical protein